MRQILGSSGILGTKVTGFKDLQGIRPQAPVSKPKEPIKWSPSYRIESPEHASMVAIQYLANRDMAVLSDPLLKALRPQLFIAVATGAYRKALTAWRITASPDEQQEYLDAVEAGKWALLWKPEPQLSP